MDSQGIEPWASRMLSGCDTTTPTAQLMPACTIAAARHDLGKGRAGLPSSKIMLAAADRALL